LSRSNKKQARARRYAKRMKSHAKWKHGKSKAERVRRKEVALNLKTQ
jgi:hypothetical protein